MQSVLNKRILIWLAKGCEGVPSLFLPTASVAARILSDLMQHMQEKWIYAQLHLQSHACNLVHGMRCKGENLEPFFQNIHHFNNVVWKSTSHTSISSHHQNNMCKWCLNDGTCHKTVNGWAYHSPPLEYTITRRGCCFTTPPNYMLYSRMTEKWYKNIVMPVSSH